MRCAYCTLRGPGSASHQLDVADIGGESVSRVKVTHLRQAIEFEMCYISQSFMRFNQAHKHVSKALSSPVFADDDIKDKGLEREIGEHAGEADQLVLCIDESNA